MLDVDLLIVGCGLTGSVIAREAAEKDLRVQIWERRSHIAGNMYDFRDAHGILVQLYGPHIFHTKQKTLMDYVAKYADWQPFQLRCGAMMDGIETPSPFNFKTIDDFYSPDQAEDLKTHIRIAYGDRKMATIVELLQHPDPVIQEYAQFLFDKDYSPYTAKQWGISHSEIDISVLKRVPVRFSYDEGYFDDAYQALPQKSYTAFFERLLNHPNIKIALNTEALTRISVIEDRLMLDGQLLNIPVVYTGALDELFKGAEGRLPYRSLRFDWKHEPVDSKQTYPVVAYPQADGYTRITEYKKLPVQAVNGTTYAVEYPLAYQAGQNTEPYYPVITDASRELYKRYTAMAESIEGLFFCGRLGDFKYYNMDQALARALAMADKILRAYS